MSKLLLELVALHKDRQYAARYGNDDDILLKHTADQLNIAFHPTRIGILKSIEQIPEFAIDMHRRQCISDVLLDWLSDTTFKNNNHKQLANHGGSNNNLKLLALLALCNFDAYSNGL